MKIIQLNAIMFEICVTKVRWFRCLSGNFENEASRQINFQVLMCFLRQQKRPEESSYFSPKK